MALSAVREIIFQEPDTITVPVKGSTTIYKGALVKVTAAGYAAPEAAEANAYFAGIALETVDNSAGSDGDLSVQLKCRADAELTVSGFAQSDLGSKLYASADDTVSTTQASNEHQVGIVVGFISATKVRARLTPFV